MELVESGHIPSGLHSQIELTRVRGTLSWICESHFESPPIGVVERFPKTFRDADQVPQSFESVIVYRRLRPNGSHVGIIETRIAVYDHPYDFYRKLVN